MSKISMSKKKFSLIIISVAIVCIVLTYVVLQTSITKKLDRMVEEGILKVEAKGECVKCGKDCQECCELAGVPDCKGKIVCEACGGTWQEGIWGGDRGIRGLDCWWCWPYAY